MQRVEVILLALVIAVIPAAVLAFVLLKTGYTKGNDDLICFSVGWFICWVLIGIKLWMRKSN